MLKNTEIDPEWSKKRPNFGHHQVRTPKGLVPGKFYIWEIAPKPFRRIVIQIIDSPYYDDEEICCVNIRIFSHGGPVASHKLPLSMVSLYPLKNGDWNTRNCIMRLPNYKIPIF